MVIVAMVSGLGLALGGAAYPQASSGWLPRTHQRMVFIGLGLFLAALLVAVLPPENTSVKVTSGTLGSETPREVVNENSAAETQVVPEDHSKELPDLRSVDPGTVASRDKFLVPLQRFASEGQKGRLLVQGNPGDQQEVLKPVWIWMFKTSTWICHNMGDPALNRFLSRPPPSGSVGESYSPGQRAAIFMGPMLENLEALMKTDVYDPRGKIVLPSEGCDKKLEEFKETAASTDATP